MTPANPVLTLTAQGAGTKTVVVRLDGGAKGFKIFVNIKSGSGTLPTLTLAVADVIPDGENPINVAPALLTSAALVASAAAITELTVYPGIAVSSNVAASAACAQDIQITVTIGGTLPVVNAEISVVAIP